MTNVFFKKLSDKPLEMPVPGIIHMWRLNENHLNNSLLSQEERARYAKYVSINAGNSFVKSRGGIRRVTATYTGRSPESFLISYDVHGKPLFLNMNDFHFNLSHSGDLAVAAISTSHVGVDVEHRGGDRDFIKISQRFFNACEIDQIINAGDALEDVFLYFWTAKEAMLKLSGKGISGGLQNAKMKKAGEGYLGRKRVFLEHFSSGENIGAIASFAPFEVKGWFDL